MHGTMHALLTRFLAFIVAGLLGVAAVEGAISVGNNGSALWTFDSLPSAGDWSQRGIQSPDGSAAVVNGEQMDAQVQWYAATDFNFELLVSEPSPPFVNEMVQWSSAGYIQTRPTIVAWQGLMATLRNDTETNLSSISLAYDVDVAVPIVEQVPGHRLYYSLTGESGSWQVVQQVSNAGHFNIQLNLPSLWMRGSLLFLLWADDNASGGLDTAYQIDNFIVAPISGISGLPPTLAAESGDRAVVIGSSTRFSVAASGTEPLVFQWFHNDLAILAATNSVFSLPNVDAGDTGGYRCVITNMFGAVTSRVAQLKVSFIQILALPGIVVTGTPGKTYRIEAAPQAGGDWTTVTNLPLPQAPYIWVDYGAAAVGSRVYRVAELP